MNERTVVLGFREHRCRLTRHVHITEMIRRHLNKHSEDEVYRAEVTKLACLQRPAQSITSRFVKNWEIIHTCPPTQLSRHTHPPQILSFLCVSQSWEHEPLIPRGTSRLETASSQSHSSPSPGHSADAAQMQAALFCMYMPGCLPSLKMLL